MVRKLTPEEWLKIGEITNRVKELEEALEKKGYEVVNEFSTGINVACLTLIVKRGLCYIMRVSVTDVLADPEKVEKEIFDKAEEILRADVNALEIEALRARLAELEGKSNSR